MKRFLVALLVGAALVGGATASQAQILVDITSLVSGTGTSGSGQSTISPALPNPTITPAVNAQSPGSDFTAGGFTSTSVSGTSETTEDHFTDVLTLTGVTFPGVNTFTTSLFARADLNATQSNATVYSLTSGGPQIAAGTILGTVAVGGVNYTISFANNDSIPNPGAAARGSFSLHISAPPGLTPVPEPSTWAMFATSGIGGLMFFRRRRA